MGRGCTMDEWIHFEKLVEDGRVPNSSYWYVHCRHCVRGYEQKQLFNPPTKLTGRRSAMRAHLKVCPMYAAQYKMEQHALSQMQSLSDEHETSSIHSDTTMKRKRRGDEVEISGPRGGRGKHCLMEEWDHFIRLQEEGYIGKSNFFYAICRHCQMAYENAPEEKKSMLVPERMVGRREKMRKHLSLCPHFIGDLPSMERRMAGRTTGGGPLAFLPMPTPDGIKMVPASALVSGEIMNDKTESSGVDTQASSRLALDEWQAFTRLHRKKDSAYYYARCNFCQQAYDNAPEALKPSMSPTIVMGRKSNMQTHLAKCPYVPKEAHTYLHSTEMFKRLKSSPSEGSNADLTSLYMAIMEFTVQQGLPFTWVDNSSAQKLFKMVDHAMLPSAKELRGPILTDIYDNVLTMELEKLKQRVPLSTGTSESETLNTIDAPCPVTLEIREIHRSSEESVLDNWLTSVQARVPLLSIVDQSKLDKPSLTITYQHGLELARLLDAQLRQVQPLDDELTIRRVMVPTSPVFTRAIGILRSRWPSLVFSYDTHPLIIFCLRKTLETTQVQVMVDATAQLWANDSIVRAYVQSKGGFSESWSPFINWQSFVAFTQAVLEMPPAIQALVEKCLELPKLTQVSALLNAFTVALSVGKPLGMAEALVNFMSLYKAADGFDDVQRALEVAWAQCEQPLYLLALALHPQLRHKLIAMAQQNVKLAQLSVLSDYSVFYFTQFLSRKPTTLRGDVTSFLHLSKSTFSDAFINEFPVMEDYFRYLKDNYVELAALMQVLQSFPSAHQVTQVSVQNHGFTMDEIIKIEVIAQRWSRSSQDEEVTGTNINIVTKWLVDINEQLINEQVDLSELDVAYEALCGSAQPPSIDEVQLEFGNDFELASIDTASQLPLPTQANDDITTYPSSELEGIRGYKVQLAQLVHPQVIDV